MSTIKRAEAGVATRYRISHHTQYNYQLPVSLSQQLLHLQPRTLPWQHIHSAQIHCTPEPQQRTSAPDAFGNPALWLDIRQPHQELLLSAELDISVLPRAMPNFLLSPPWQDVVERCRFRGVALSHPEQLDALAYRQESPYVRIKHDFARFALPCFGADDTLLTGVYALTLKMYNEFEFDSEATDVGTPLLTVLEQRRGVCQDFAHLMIACLRSLGLPARYVSGYLLTEPPEGQPRLIGADASHAWVSVWCPHFGWVDFDPTNGVLPDQQHITLAWGRDFSDVSPLRGVIIGGGEHTLDVSVTVMPVPPSRPGQSQSQSQ
jgi:transglutaminase-like putative cysteine protease